MKKTMLLLFLAVGAIYAYSQENNTNDYEIKTIFSKQRGNGVYGAFSAGYSKIDGADGFISGARIAWVIDHLLGIGIAGYGFVNDFNYKEIIEGNPANVGLAGGYGGLFVEPVLGSRLPVHLSFPVLFGVGGVALVEDDGWWDHYYTYESNTDVYLIVEPAAELELNLARFMRLSGWVSYRFTSDIEIEGTSPNALNGWSTGLTFKIGKF